MFGAIVRARRPDGDEPTVPEVLFVCVHNAGRSQMAAALLERLRRARSGSAPRSAPADEVNPAVVAAMAELGIDISPSGRSA